MHIMQNEGTANIRSPMGQGCTIVHSWMIGNALHNVLKTTPGVVCVTWSLLTYIGIANVGFLLSRQQGNAGVCFGRKDIDQGIGVLVESD